jgi:hypothetical protein
VRRTLPARFSSPNVRAVGADSDRFIQISSKPCAEGYHASARNTPAGGAWLG